MALALQLIVRQGRQDPISDAQHHVRLKRDKALCVWRYIDPIKGRGVFALEPIRKGSFILEYRGVLEKTEKTATWNEYTYIFKHKGTEYCIDASSEDGTLGRLVNDAEKPNAKIKKIEVDGVPSLCLFAIVDIEEGQEITYDYGGENLPWRSCQRHQISKPMAPTTVKKPVPHTPVLSPATSHTPVVSPSTGHTSVVSPSTGHTPVVSPSASHTPVVSPSTGHTPFLSSTVLPEEMVGSQQQAKRPGSCNDAFEEQRGRKRRKQENSGGMRKRDRDCKTHHVVKENLGSFEKCSLCRGPFSSLKWWGLRCEVCTTVWHTYCFHSKDKRQKTSPMAPTVEKPVLHTPVLSPATSHTPVMSPSTGHTPVVSPSTGHTSVVSASTGHTPVVSPSTGHTISSTVLPEEPTHSV
ncbi:uncharacterized protein LOC125900330 [Epinephelus fuscoguttatus]|uniref:uncharacterized protein LOC125900330 n=1 Tax=Epinephelus fuscoguttatus TaxID=293821 RepID=UPI0020D0BDD0|nr:uncharacterized protein LOC125900330 [Epinephelus fuscoguttatus]